MAIRVDKRMTDMLPKGVLSYAMKLPALKDIRRTLLADLGIPDTVIEHMALVPRFDARDTQRALRDTGIEVPPLAASRSSSPAPRRSWTRSRTRSRPRAARRTSRRAT